MSDFVFETNCVGSDSESIHAMRDDATEITYNTFRRRVLGLQDWARGHGYDRSFPLSGDWHVAYYKSTYRGRPCFYLVWSGYEEIWVSGGESGDSPCDDLRRGGSDGDEVECSFCGKSISFEESVETKSNGDVCLTCASGQWCSL